MTTMRVRTVRRGQENSLLRRCHGASHSVIAAGHYYMGMASASRCHGAGHSGDAGHLLHGHWRGGLQVVGRGMAVESGSGITYKVEE